jgi:hypothetical protein
MADYTGTVQAVELVRGPDDAYGAEAAGGTVYSAALSIWNDTANTIAGGTDTLAVNAATAIQSARRDGKTVTVRSAAVIGAAVVGGTTYGGTVSIASAPTIKISPTNTASPWANATLPANTSTTQRYYRVIVGYTVV